MEFVEYIDIVTMYDEPVKDVVFFPPHTKVDEAIAKTKEVVYDSAHYVLGKDITRKDASIVWIKEIYDEEEYGDTESYHYAYADKLETGAYPALEVCFNNNY